MDGQVNRSMDDNGRRINVMSIKRNEQMFFMLLAFTQPFLGFHICQQIRVTRAVTLTGTDNTKVIRIVHLFV